MRSAFSFILLCGLLLCAAPTPASAQWDENRDAARAEILEALRTAPTEEAAAPIVDEIWAFWRVGPDSEATARLLGAWAHLRAGEIDSAISVLDAITSDYPDWAEPWNLRATALYYVGRHAESLEDIERTLAIEPAHFGALSGAALIHFYAGRDLEARIVLRAATEIHPWLPERRFLDEPTVQ